VPIVFRISSILILSTCTCTAFRNKTLILTRGDVIISLILNYVPRIDNLFQAESWTGRDYVGTGKCFFSLMTSSPAYTWIFPRGEGGRSSFLGRLPSVLVALIASGFPLYWFAMTFDATTLTMLFSETGRVTACIARVLKTGMRHSLRSIRIDQRDFASCDFVFPFLQMTDPKCTAHYL